MCGRYSFVPSKKQLDEQLSIYNIPQPLQVSFNIAPTQLAYVITNNLPQVLQSMHWGLVPFWSKEGTKSGKLINARAESILEKPSFRAAAVQRHCLVPADSFYEWRTLPAKRKVPYRIRLKNKKIMFLAGIWEEWRSSNNILHTFSIITTKPNAEISALHNRMPVLFLEQELQNRWLTTSDPEEVKELLCPPSDDILEIYRVSERLNTPGTDSEELHREVSENDTPTLF